MSDTSPRFALPWLHPGQAQKEAFHNEALAIVDAVLHPAVTAVGTATPPAAPTPGQAWLAGAAPTGAWAGHAHHLVIWTDGGWRFVAPVMGMTLWSIADGVPVRWTGTAWTIGVVAATRIEVNGERVVAARQPAVATPAGGAVIDSEARAAITALLVAARTHGLIAA